MSIRKLTEIKEELKNRIFEYGTIAAKSYISQKINKKLIK